MDKNRFLIAAAGAGKTTKIVRDALSQQEGVLLVTFTDINRGEIMEKVIKEKGCIPSNITITTWFSFLIQHGVKPYQSSYHPSFENVNFSGLILCKTGHEGRIEQETPQRKKMWTPVSEKKNPLQHYSSKDGRLYSDRLPKLVVRIGEKSNGRIYQRISRIFPHIYVDEVQDLCGYDLDILKALFSTKSKITLVGDPRQYVFSTHREKKYSNYDKGRVRNFILDKCSKGKFECKVDDVELNVSHRNSDFICRLSSSLYEGEYPTVSPCHCYECGKLRTNGAIRAVHKIEAKEILRLDNNVVQLRYDNKVDILSLEHKVLNMGISKGLTFDSVMIYLTKDMKDWLRNRSHPLQITTKAKLYIAITRARKNVYFVFDDNEILPEFPQEPTLAP